MKPISGPEFAKLLRKRGWVLSRVEGSHHIFEKPGEVSPVSVPFHGSKALRVGTQLALMRQTGITRDEL